MRRRAIRTALGVAAWCALSLTLAAQQPPAESGDPALLPVEQWLAEGPREDFRWTVRVRGPWLTAQQWQSVLVEVEVRAKTLAQLGPQVKLVLAVAIADSDGVWIAQRLARWEAGQRLPSRVRLIFTTPVLLSPGEYTAGVVLFERLSGARSVTLQPLRVSRVSNDPLAWAAHFPQRVEIFPPAKDDLDSLYQPELPVPLHLRAETQQPVELELLVNFSPPEIYGGRRAVYWNNVRTLLAALKILAQIELPNGRINVTALDLLRQRILFRQENILELDWPGLRAALEETDPGLIDLRSLERRRKAAGFFRDVLAERLFSTGAPALSGSPPAGPPQRLFIVLSTGYLFPSGSDRSPLPVPPDCRCRVYLMENRMSAPSLWDHLKGMMGTLPLRRVVMETPLDFRKALSEILKDLRTM